MVWMSVTRGKQRFYEEAWKRDELAPWDGRWAALSPAARKVFSEQIPIAVRSSSAMQPAAAKMPAAVRDELIEAGFIELTGKKAIQVRAVEGVRAFGTRVKALRRFHLLDPAEGAFTQYLQYAFHVYAMVPVLERIVADAVGPCPGLYFDDFLTHFIGRRFWPDWVATYLDDPAAEAVVRCVAGAGGRLPLESLPSRLPKHPPDKVREATDALMHHLALVEDLDPQTYGLVVGFRPEVEADRQRADRPQPSGPPALHPAPAAPSPAGGLRVLDVRAVLLELAGQRARIRHDGSLYVKEHERFLPALVEAPAWMNGEASDPLRRLESTVRQVRSQGFVSQVDSGVKDLFLELSVAGRRWLSGDLGSQYDLLYRLYRKPGDDAFRWYSSTDEVFTGSQVMALHKKARGGAKLSSWQVGDDDRQRFRDAIHRALDRLPAAGFVRQADFIEAVVAGPDNPVLLGETDPREVEVRYHNRTLPPLLDIYQDYGRRLLRDVLDRLLLMGGVQAGPDAEGKLLISRQPWLDVYFGKAAPPAELSTAAGTKTVVQPDFSVIVIGPNPAAAADLATFCDRVQGNVGEGALTFRIRRESVLRAVGMGLAEAAILDRLTKHASATPPANVVRQIRDWCGQVRQVTSRAGRLFRCPDEGTADRVRALLGKEAERIGETMVFWSEEGRVRPALRQKLREQGVLLDEADEGGRKVKRRGSS